ncbi:MAG: diacylglycerol kinase family lipid kinase, partial [Sphingobacteriales bacterium]
MEKKNILFVINPISGGKDKRGFPIAAAKFLDSSIFNAQFEFTQYAHHADELASNAVSSGVDIVVAVGGDGTINEVASALVDTKTIMGIVPCGSGNGLARSLKISLKTENAVRTLNQLNIDTIDTAELAGGKFFNMGGIGFDA